MLHRLSSSWLARWLPLAALLAAALDFVLKKGQDANWDLRNYHLYNPHALLHGRGEDIAAAQLQGWYNPLLDLPFYLLATADISGVWASLWLLLPAVVGFTLMMLIFQSFPARVDSPALRLWAGLVLAAALVGGAAAAPSLGTSMNEWFVAAGVLAGLWSLLKQLHSVERRPVLLVVGGALAGGVAGLKLTAISYCLGLGAACAVLAWARRDIRCLLLFGSAGLAGGLLTAGPWALHLWWETGNPVFPYMNHLIGSEFARPQDFVFAEFKPDSLGAAVMAPFRLAQGGHWFSELELRDPRLLLGQLAASAILMARLWRPRAAISGLELLAVFWWFSFAAWIGLHAIYRYAIPLELVSSLLVVGLLLRLPKVPTALGLVGLLWIVQTATLRPNWGRVEFSTPFIANRWPELPDDSVLVTLDGDPVGYTAIGLADDVPIVALANNLIFTDECRSWQRQAMRRIERSANVFALQVNADPTSLAIANARIYGLEHRGDCQEIASTLADFWLCPLLRVRQAQCR